MKIGIITLFYNNYNWGGVLQGYALKKYIEKNYNDCVVDILRYHSSYNIIYNNRISQSMQYSFLDVFKKIIEVLTREKKEKYLKTRKKIFDLFTEKYGSAKKKYDDQSLKEAGTEYDYIICGSDQIWNPNLSRPGYYLSMIEHECKKVAYAASIARPYLSKHEANVIIPLINKFDYISVREKTAKKILKEYTEKEIVETLDPAFLISKEEWVSIASENICEGDYVLSFFFSESRKYRERIGMYCTEKGLKQVSVPFASNKYIRSDLLGEGEKIMDVGPSEFIRLFLEAKYIFTDSFHGTAFSIIFNKNFAVFERDKNNKVSKNSRLYDLLEKFDLSSRLVTKKNDLYNVINEPIDYLHTNFLLNKYRSDSEKFIENVFAGDHDSL